MNNVHFSSLRKQFQPKSELKLRFCNLYSDYFQFLKYPL